MGLAVAASANVAPIKDWKSIVAVISATTFTWGNNEKQSSSQLIAKVNEVFQWDGLPFMLVPCSRALPAQAPMSIYSFDVDQASRPSC